MAANIMNHWKRNEPADFSFPENLDQKSAWDLAGKISHHLILDGYKQRSDAKQLTGEWIVFARQDSVAYYLTLASHFDDDSAVWAKMPSLQKRLTDEIASLEGAPSSRPSRTKANRPPRSRCRLQSRSSSLS